MICRCSLHSQYLLYLIVLCPKQVNCVLWCLQHMLPSSLAQIYRRITATIFDFTTFKKCCLFEGICIREVWLYINSTCKSSILNSYSLTYVFAVSLFLSRHSISFCNILTSTVSRDCYRIRTSKNRK